MTGLIIFALANIPGFNGNLTQTGATLTIDQAVAIGEKAAYANLTAESALRKSSDKVDETVGALRPTFTFGGTYTRFDQASTANFGGATITTQPIDTKSIDAKISWTIDVSGNLLKVLRSSKASYLSAKETKIATENSTKLTVRSDYYAILRALAQEAVLDETVKADEVRVKTTEQELTAGTVAKVDLLNAQAQLAQAQSNLITAKDSVTLAKQTLNYELARPVDTPIEVVDVAGMPSIKADPMTIINYAQQNRPEVKALQHTVYALKEIKDATKSGLLPTLNFSITGTENLGAQGLGGRTQTATGVASLNFPLYDGGQTRAKVKEASEDEEQAKIQLSQVTLEVSLQVQQALTTFADAKARYDVALKQIDASKEALRLAILKQSQGEGIYLEVLDAQTNYTTAETALVNARYDLFGAIANLQLAYGSDVLPTDETPSPNSK